MNSQVYHIKKDFWELKGEISRVKKSIQEDAEAFEQDVQSILDQMRDERILYSKSNRDGTMIERDPANENDAVDLVIVDIEESKDTNDLELSKTLVARKEAVSDEEEHDNAVASACEEQNVEIPTDTSKSNDLLVSNLPTISQPHLEAPQEETASSTNTEPKEDILLVDSVPSTTSSKSGSILDHDLNYLLSDEVLKSLEQEDTIVPDASNQTYDDLPAMSTADVDNLIRYFSGNAKVENDDPPTMANSKIEELLFYAAGAAEKTQTTNSNHTVDSAIDDSSSFAKENRHIENPSITADKTTASPPELTTRAEAILLAAMTASYEEEVESPTSATLAILENPPSSAEVVFEKVRSFLIDSCCCSYTFSIPSRK